MPCSHCKSPTACDSVCQAFAREQMPHGVMASGELAGLPVEIDRTNAPKAQRSAFEVAMRELHPEWTFTRDPVFDYHNERTRCAWEGWKAALGVLVGAKDQPAGGPDA